jgi:glycosyltransferase involved in cell wall biosynthesis
MRIGFDAKRAFQNHTGLGNYSRILLSALLRLHPESEFFFYTPKKPKGLFPDFENEARSRAITRTPDAFFSRRFPPLWRSFGLAQSISRDNVRLFHGLSHEIPSGLRQKGVKSAVTIHDLISLKFPELYPWADRQIYRMKLKYACANADRVIADSAQTSSDIQELFSVGADRVRVIPLACEPRFEQRIGADEKERVRKKYALPGRFILSVGTINSRKNLLALVKAFSLMRDASTVALVAIGGGGAYKRKVEAFVNERKLSDRVLFRDQVPSADLPAIYQQAELFAYPSLYEGFGYPIIEALKSRVPVVTSAGGCFPEAGGPGSVYVDPQNAEEICAAMRRILSDSALRARMIGQGETYAARFNERAFADATWDVYKELLG